MATALGYASLLLRDIPPPEELAPAASGAFGPAWWLGLSMAPEPPIVGEAGVTCAAWWLGLSASSAPPEVGSFSMFAPWQGG